MFCGIFLNFLSPNVVNIYGYQFPKNHVSRIIGSEELLLILIPNT